MQSSSSYHSYWISLFKPLIKVIISLAKGHYLDLLKEKSLKRQFNEKMQNVYENKTMNTLHITTHI